MEVPVEGAEQTQTECPEAWCHSHVRAHHGATLLHYASMYTHTHTHITQIRANAHNKRHRVV